MMYDVALQIATPISLATVRRRARHAELPIVVTAACGYVWEVVKAAKIEGGRMVSIYHNANIDLEVGVEVPGPFPDTDDVRASATPAGPVATVAHMGDYGRLGQAHAAIREFCAARGFELAGPNWEIYGHWSDNPAEVRTDVFHLLKPV